MSESLQQLIRLQFKRGKNAEFDISTYSNYVLEYGEPFFDISTATEGKPGKLYIGDGVSALSQLNPINLDITANLIANAINNSTSSDDKINGNKINGAVELATRLGDSNNSKTLAEILAESGINAVNKTGEGNVVTSVEKVDKTLVVDKNLNAVKADEKYFDKMTSAYNVGGIASGENLSDYTLIELIKKIFSSAIANFHATFDTNQSGATISATAITPTFTGGQDTVTLRVWEEGSSTDVLNREVTSGTKYSFSVPISTTTSTIIHAVLQDSTTSQEITYTLTPAALGVWYYGLLPENVDRTNITEADLIGLTTGQALKPSSNLKNINFGNVDVANRLICFVYPASLGKLSKAYVEQEAYDELSSWTDNNDKTNVKSLMVTIEGEQVEYYAYIKIRRVFDSNYSCNFKW